MILGFKDQFVPYVLEGSKTHTIRAGQRWRAGMRADLFKNVRQKNMELLFRAPVVRVQQIKIFTRRESLTYQNVVEIKIDGAYLDKDELNSFAWRDGFRWRTSPCASCCNWAGCNTLEACRQIGYPKDFGCFNRMAMFWQKEHKIDGEPFYGQLIHWDYEQRFTDISETCYRETICRAKVFAECDRPMERAR